MEITLFTLPHSLAMSFSSLLCKSQMRMGVSLFQTRLKSWVYKKNSLRQTGRPPVFSVQTDFQPVSDFKIGSMTGRFELGSSGPGGGAVPCWTGQTGQSSFHDHLNSHISHSFLSLFHSRSLSLLPSLALKSQGDSYILQVFFLFFAHHYRN